MIARRLPARRRDRKAPAARRARAALGAGVLGAAVLALTLSGCGIPLQSTAHPLSIGAKDKALSPPTTTTSPQTVAGYVQVSVYFTIDASYVVPEPRYLKPPAKLGTVLDLLLDGPQTSERYRGIETALSPAVRLLSSHTTKNVVTLDFSPAFYTLSGTQEVLGVAQVVETVDADKPGMGVFFEVEGVSLPVPVQTGALATGPVRSSQYQTLVVATTTTSTTAG